MTDEQQSQEHPPFMEFPADMQVAQGVSCRFAVNRSDDQVWLWLRWPTQTTAVGFAPEAAVALGKGLVEMARQVQGDQLTIEAHKLLGPDGGEL